MSMTPDESDDDEVDPVEIEEASEAISGAVLGEPEVNEETEDLTVWDEPPDSAGIAVPRVTMDDEISPAEQLVEEGLEEADRDQRLAAVDPDFEP